MTIDTIKILLPTVATFMFGIIFAPYFIKFLLANELWKKKSVTKTIDGKEATLTNKIHNDEQKKVPRLGGFVIWGSAVLVSLVFWTLPKLFDFVPDKIDFISRNQTWLILFGMIFAGLLGALDDISTCGKKVPLIGKDGLSFKWRGLLVMLLSFFIGYWFYFKLGFTSVFVPFFGLIYVGIGIFALITFFTLMMFATSNIDGIDGLSGGLFAILFGSYGIIALAQNQIDIASLCFAIVGGCIAFLWYNIIPAQFYNTETGILALSISITLIAFLTNQIFVLPIIALPLLSAPISAILQLLSKKFLNKKIFLVAPMHHHFQVAGMQSETVVMRYWLFGSMCAFLGVVIALAGRL
jgi:phospho-N-acetylmuramoyl-pentapeptide-transferase